MHLMKQSQQKKKPNASIKPVFIKHHSIVKGIIQPKLKIGAPNDKYEQEADRVADQVMRMSAPIQSSSINNSPISNISNIQRKCAGCAKEDEFVQKKLSGKTPDVTPTINSNIQSLQGGGKPLSNSEKNFFEPRFGTDFSHVRLHTNSQATNTAKSINARAFTYGNNVVFNSGEYSPGSHQGNFLLAHELTHVVQQMSPSSTQLIQRSLPSVSGRDFRNSGTTDGENRCRVCPKSIGVLADGKMSNGMEWQFTLADHRSGVIYDILRTKRTAYWEKTSSGDWNIFESNPSGTFDDSHNGDEDLSPNHQHIYSIDIPGYTRTDGTRGFNPRGSSPGSTEIVQNINFAEWVSAKDTISGEGWSRISRFAWWHTKLWVIKDASGVWNVDLNKSSIENNSLPSSTFTSAP